MSDPISNAVDQVLTRYVAGDVLRSMRQELLEVLPHAFAATVATALTLPPRASTAVTPAVAAAAPKARAPRAPRAKTASPAATTADGKNALMSEKKALFWARKRAEQGKEPKPGDAKLIAKWEKIEAKEAAVKAKAEAKAAAQAAKAAAKASKPKPSRKKAAAVAAAPAAVPAAASSVPSPLAQAQARRNGTTDAPGLTVVSENAPL